MLSAQEQYKQLAQKFAEYELRYNYHAGWLMDTDWDVTAVRIFQDLKAKIDAYGDKAYPLSDKQMDVLDRYFARWGEILTTHEATVSAKQTEKTEKRISSTKAKIAASRKICEETEKEIYSLPGITPDGALMLARAIILYDNLDAGQFSDKAKYEVAQKIRDNHYTKLAESGYSTTKN